MDGGLIEGPLTSIQSNGRFKLLEEKIRKLPTFRDNDRRGHGMYGSALNKFAEYLEEGFDTDIEDDIDAIISEDALSETEKSNVLKTRIGQGGFRQKLINYWGCCAVTGYKDPTLLVASHIKPWRAASNSERLDHFNGLLLIPTIDKAFDSGFITFETSGEIVLSPLLENPEILGIDPKMGISLEKSHKGYMDFHREVVFRST